MQEDIPIGTKVLCPWNPDPKCDGKVYGRDLQIIETFPWRPAIVETEVFKSRNWYGVKIHFEHRPGRTYFRRLDCMKLIEDHKPITTPANEDEQKSEPAKTGEAAGDPKQTQPQPKRKKRQRRKARKAKPGDVVTGTCNWMHRDRHYGFLRVDALGYTNVFLKGRLLDEHDIVKNDIVTVVIKGLSTEHNKYFTDEVLNVDKTLTITEEEIADVQATFPEGTNVLAAYNRIREDGEIRTYDIRYISEMPWMPATVIKAPHKQDGKGTLGVLIQFAHRPDDEPAFWRVQWIRPVTMPSLGTSMRPSWMPTGLAPALETEKDEEVVSDTEPDLPSFMNSSPSSGSPTSEEDLESRNVERKEVDPTDI